MMAKKTGKTKVTRKASEKSKPAAKGPKYLCVLCGTEIIITSEGAAFVELVCCGKSMIKK
jgi:hypothetical protein